MHYVIRYDVGILAGTHQEIAVQGETKYGKLCSVFIFVERLALWVAKGRANAR